MNKLEQKPTLFVWYYSDPSFDVASLPLRIKLSVKGPVIIIYEAIWCGLDLKKCWQFKQKVDETVTYFS